MEGELVSGTVGGSCMWADSWVWGVLEGRWEASGWVGSELVGQWAGGAQGRRGREHC